MRTTKSEISPRERLLTAANELFYEEGVRSVGIDRIIERAGVAKASLYSAFGSKEELVRAYLEERAAARRERITRRIAQHTDPRAKILAVFDLMGETVLEPTFRGCPFVNASVEEPRGETKVRKVCAAMREWLRGVFTDLARETGARDPASAGRRLAILYNGAVVSAAMDDDPAVVAAQARAMAECLLDAQAAPRRERKSSARR